jgi:general secretion pathway protein G
MNVLHKKGFSLLELLVSATIIAVLTTIGIVSYSSVNKRSRDVKRKSDIEQIRSALEMYRSDNGQYPNPSLDVLVTGGYMPVVPTDSDTSSYPYESILVGGSYTAYCVCAHLETLSSPVDMCTALPMPGVCNYRLKNP